MEINRIEIILIILLSVFFLFFLHPLILLEEDKRGKETKRSVKSMLSERFYSCIFIRSISKIILHLHCT